MAGKEVGGEDKTLSLGGGGGEDDDVAVMTSLPVRRDAVKSLKSESKRT